MSAILSAITELQALSQTGLHYSKDPFDKERCQRFMEISAELAAQVSGQEFSQVLQVFSAETGYRTPKVEVRGAIFKDDKILLVREKADNLWSLPGGWADVNLAPSENVLKEIREEAGLECTIIKLIAVVDKKKNNPRGIWPSVYKMFFLCEAISGSFEDSIEISEAGFFDLRSLPELSPERVIEKQIEMCFMHHSQPNLPTQFD